MPDRNEKADNDRTAWALDREIVLSRVVAAPRNLVFKAWTDPQHLPHWFGPAGFKVETQEIDIRVGGRWRFVFVAPDGGSLRPVTEESFRGGLKRQNSISNSSPFKWGSAPSYGAMGSCASTLRRRTTARR